VVCDVLGLAKRLRVPILQASTSEVYGDPQQHSQSEDCWGHVNPIGPRSCYDEGERVVDNTLPFIDSVVACSAAVAPGDTVVLSATTHDVEPAWRFVVPCVFALS
jgi:hypothetical protein